MIMSAMSLFNQSQKEKKTTAISIIANLRSLVLTEIYPESTDCTLEPLADIFRKTVKTPVFIGDHLMDQRQQRLKQLHSCPLILTIGSLCRSSSLSIIISTKRRVKQCIIRRNEVRKGLNGGKNEEREKKIRVFMDKHFYVKRIKDILLKRNCIGLYLSGGRMTRAGPTTASCLSL